MSPTLAPPSGVQTGLSLYAAVVVGRLWTPPRQHHLSALWAEAGRTRLDSKELCISRDRPGHPPPWTSHGPATAL